LLLVGWFIWNVWWCTDLQTLNLNKQLYICMFRIIMLLYIYLPSWPNNNALCITVDRGRFSALRLDHWVQKSGHLCDAGYFRLNCVVLTSQCYDVGRSDLISSSKGATRKFRMRCLQALLESAGVFEYGYVLGMTARPSSWFLVLLRIESVALIELWNHYYIIVCS
jgi:hypothetical protein